MWLDRIVAIASMIALTLFMGVLVWYVARVNLTVIVVIVLLMAYYDFWRTLKSDGSKQVPWSSNQRDDSHRL